MITTHRSIYFIKNWLSLLIIPLALALAALFFNQMNTNTKWQIAQQRYDQDYAIAEYPFYPLLDWLSSLLGYLSAFSPSLHRSKDTTTRGGAYL